MARISCSPTQPQNAAPVASSQSTCSSNKRSQNPFRTSSTTTSCSASKSEVQVSNPLGKLRHMWLKRAASDASCSSVGSNGTTSTSGSSSISGSLSNLVLRNRSLKTRSVGSTLVLEIEDSSDNNSEFTSSTSSPLSFFAEDEPLPSALKLKTQDDSLQQVYGQSKSSQAKTKRASVGFNKVTTHYHCLCLGDHPLVSSGAPIALGERECTDTVTVSEHEQERTWRNHVYKPFGLRTTLSSMARERMLVQEGFLFQTIRRHISRIKIQKDLDLRKSLLASSQLSRQQRLGLATTTTESV